MTECFTINGTVDTSMIDHNQHMHDADFNKVFSEASNAFNYQHGLSLEDRTRLNYTIFTLEEHTTFLSQLKLNDYYSIRIYLYNYDYKRVHFFLMMYGSEDQLVATNELMMMGIDRDTEKSAPFPKQYLEQIETYYQQQPNIDWPKQLGHRIVIPNKEDK
ncbi:thioesterase family protein [Staphylococcus debuckii]|uniref:Thioesterase family protein n=1 Tax=Staphylococcus debuckii TaxID=2044912 RepID=A0ABU9EWU9_9STAP|nr:thioesterase family protein [Staphylococcus debuckii]AYU55970.1 thioesterase [Staphylococcus debuckii]